MGVLGLSRWKKKYKKKTFETLKKIFALGKKKKRKQNEMKTKTKTKQNENKDQNKNEEFLIWKQILLLILSF